MSESHPHLEQYPNAEQDKARAYEMAHAVPEAARIGSLALHNQINNAAEFTKTDAGFDRLSGYLDKVEHLAAEEDVKGLELAKIQEAYTDADDLTETQWARGKAPFRGRYPTDKGNVHGRVKEISEMPHDYLSRLKPDMTPEEVTQLKHEIIDPFLETLPAGAEVQAQEVADLDARIEQAEQQAAAEYDKNKN